MEKIEYMSLNGGIMGQVASPQKDQLQPVHNWILFLFLANWATDNCSPVAISCGPVQLPVFAPVANWTLKHYFQPHLISYFPGEEVLSVLLLYDPSSFMCS